MSLGYREAARRTGAAIGITAVLATTGALLTGASEAPAPATASDAPERARQASAKIDDLSGFLNAWIGLRESQLVRLPADLEAAPEVQTAIEVDGRMYTLDMHLHSVRADDYHVYLSDGDGNLTEVDPGPITTLRGEVAEDPGSIVAAGIDDDGMYARIEFSDGRSVWVEPVLGHVKQEAVDLDLAGLHVVYHKADVLDSGATCGFVNPGHAEGGPVFEDAPVLQEGSPTAGAGDPSYTCQIAFDVDFFYFSQWGEEGAIQRITFIVNSGLNIQYPRDVQIEYEVTTFIIRTSQVYTANTIDGLLDQFRTRWLQFHGNVKRDVAELFGGRNLSGGVIGIAYFDGICTSNGFNVVEQHSSFSCRTDLSAHELGHNWNAVHCSCPSNTMNAGLTCTNVFHPTFTIPNLINYRNSRGCLDVTGVPPANDDCANAILVLNENPFPFDTGDATTDGPALPAECDEGNGLTFNNDVWYNFVALCDGIATATVCGSDFDTRIAVYEGETCVGDLIACNDNDCGDQSRVSFPVANLQRFRIRVGGNNDSGTGSLMMMCVKGDPCPEDIDGSGAADFGDILAILAAWGPCGGCPEDIDGSGAADFGDILAVLAAWGPCP